MRFLPAVLSLAAFAWSGPLLRAQQALPVDPKAVLSTLKDLRAKQAGVMAREKTDVLAAINAAMTDPGRAYEQAVEAVDLQGQAPVVKPPPGRGPFNGGGNRNVMDVRKQENDQVRNREFVSGLRFQLAYLAMTWQRAMGVKTKDLLPALMEYAAQVQANDEALTKLDMYKRSLSESVFVNYFQVGPYINGVADWADHPFDVDAIYEKAILPEMRRNKDPRLLTYWDNTLQSEAARASATQNALSVSKFNHVRRPDLLWSRAEDEMLLGSANQAVADMLAIIKANPDHPDFEKWASELEGIVGAKATPPPGEVTVGPATLVTPTPGLIAPAPAVH